MEKEQNENNVSYAIKLVLSRAFNLTGVIDSYSFQMNAFKLFEKIKYKIVETVNECQ